MIQTRLDSFRLAANFPGLTLAIAYPDNSVKAFASGYADSARGILMNTADCMMQGSIGKTYVAAIAFQLIEAKRLDLPRKNIYLSGNRALVRPFAKRPRYNGNHADATHQRYYAV